MARIMKIILSVDEDKVGGIIADLSGRVNSWAFESVELVDRRARAFAPREVPKNKGRGGSRVRSPLGSINSRIKAFLSSTEIVELGATKTQIRNALSDVKPTSVDAGVGQLKTKGEVTKDGNDRWFITDAKGFTA